MRDMPSGTRNAMLFLLEQEERGIASEAPETNKTN